VSATVSLYGSDDDVVDVGMRWPCRDGLVVMGSSRWTRRCYSSILVVMAAACAWLLLHLVAMGFGYKLNSINTGLFSITKGS